MIGILIVHSCPLFREGLRAVLSAQADCSVVGETTYPQEALALVRSAHPEVMVLDDGLCDIDPHQLTREVREIGGTQVFVFVSSVDEERLFRYLQYGAAAYELPTLQCSELVARIRRVACGEYLISGEVLRPLPAPSSQRRQQPYNSTSAHEPAPLTARELEVLREIVKGGRTKQVARVLGISDQTVKNHMTSVFKKLQVQDRTAAVALALHKQWISFDECCPDSGRIARREMPPSLEELPVVPSDRSRGAQPVLV